MNIKTYLNKIKEKVKHYDKAAQNPFVKKSQFEYNPFAGAFSQTYIWVEPNEGIEDDTGKNRDKDSK